MKKSREIPSFLESVAFQKKASGALLTAYEASPLANMADAVGKGLLGLGAGALIYGGMQLASNSFKSLTEGAEKAKAFRAVLEANPGLRNEDIKKVKSIFDSIWRFSPKIAKEPYVASSFVEKVLQYGGFPIEDFHKLVSMETSLSKPDLERRKTSIEMGKLVTKLMD